MRLFPYFIVLRLSENKKTVSIHMKNQIQEAIDFFEEDIPQSDSTPANKNVFTIEHDSLE